MSEAKHTPGPWKIVYGGLPGDDGFTIASNNASAKFGAICECWPCTVVGNEHREEMLANASLIAAAPSMLEEIKIMKTVIRKVINGEWSVTELQEVIGDLT